jgi:hypothetical protein
MDRREQILAQLLVVIQGISDFAAVYRNRPMNAQTALRPACFIMDAHESRDQEQGHVWRSQGITLMRMTPEIYVSLAAAPEDVGETLNGLRAQILKAVFSDDTLQSLLTENGQILLDGTATALTMGSGVEGEMAISMTFLYPVIPSEF